MLLIHSHLNGAIAEFKGDYITNKRVPARMVRASVHNFANISLETTEVKSSVPRPSIYKKSK